MIFGKMVKTSNVWHEMFLTLWEIDRHGICLYR